MKKTKLKRITIPQDYFIGDGSYTADEKRYYDFKDIKLVENVGLLVYIGNAKHPRKGMPAAEIMLQLNTLKEYLKQKIQDGRIVFFKSFVTDFNRFFEKCFYPYRVKVKYMCAAATGVYYVLLDVLIALGFNAETANKFAFYIAHLFEFDDAYRYRAQDIVTMINLLEFYNNPRKELRRVFDIALSREVHEPQRKKMAKVYTLITYAVMLPSIQRTLKKSWVNMELIKFDESDIYWAGFKDNYNFMGVTHEEHKAINPVPNMWRVDTKK